jgi:hypothetical protein
VNVRDMSLNVVGIDKAIIQYQLNEYNDIESLGKRNHHIFLLKNLDPDTDYTIEIVFGKN